MKTALFRLFFGISISFLLACSDNNGKTETVSKGNSGFIEVPEWLGTYQDTLPCADCKGSLTRLVLNKDHTYSKSIVLLGKEPIFDNTFGTNGRWHFDSNLNVVWLDSVVEKKQSGFFIRGDSILIVCDATGTPLLENNHKLERISSKAL